MADVTLTEDEREALLNVWVSNNVNRGIEWLTPTVETIVAARVAAALGEVEARIAHAATVTTLGHFGECAYESATDIVREVRGEVGD